ncbi:MAG: quinone oxidoreductase [Vicinamibacteria bacterium]
MKALTFSRFGGSEVLEYRDVPDPVLKADQVLMAARAIGLNFSDLERRRGTYHLLGQAPYIAGYEAAGVVADPNGHPSLRAGDRIAVADVPFSNAALVAVPWSHAIPLPDDITFEVAAAILLQGLTAQYLVSDSHDVRPGETIVVTAAAGGVGQFLTRYCVLRGANVLGLTTTDAKKPLILAQGAVEAWNLKEDWKARVLERTAGRGADVVYDSVGSTLGDSFDVTRTGGHVVLYGTTGGVPAPVDPRMLMDTSKTLTGGDLWGYLTSREERIRRADELFERVRSGQIVVAPPVLFPLAEGRAAHDYLETGRSAGKVLLTA